MVETKCDDKGDTGAEKNKKLKDVGYKENPGHCPEIHSNRGLQMLI